MTVKAAAAAKLVITHAPTTAKVGVVVSPAITLAVQDAFGNVVTTDTSKVTVSVSTAPAGGSITGTLGKSALAGIASFSDLKFTKAGNYVLKFTDGSLASATDGDRGRQRLVDDAERAV